jgi:hypothetical protein
VTDLLLHSTAIGMVRLADRAETEQGEALACTLSSRDHLAAVAAGDSEEDVIVRRIRRVVERALYGPNPPEMDAALVRILELVEDFERKDRQNDAETEACAGDLDEGIGRQRGAARLLCGLLAACHAVRRAALGGVA